MTTTRRRWRRRTTDDGTTEEEEEEEQLPAGAAGKSAISGTIALTRIISVRSVARRVTWKRAVAEIDSPIVHHHHHHLSRKRRPLRLPKAKAEVKDLRELPLRVAPRQRAIRSHAGHVEEQITYVRLAST